MSDQFEQTLDRRLGDFSKVIDTKMTSIQDGVNEMRNTLTVFVDKVSNLHRDYMPRTELEKDLNHYGNQIQELKDQNVELSKKIEHLSAWRNYLTGSIAVLTFAVGVVAQHFWK